MGLELGVSCAYHIGTVHTRHGITALNLGITVGQGHIRWLVAVGGTSWAFDLLLSSRLVSSEEALRMGLAHRVVSDRESLLQEAQALGEMFLERAPMSLEWTKRMIHEITSGSHPRAVEEDADTAIRCFETEDVLEAVQVFQQKRKPQCPRR